jgi:hypothetical protein
MTADVADSSIVALVRKVVNAQRDSLDREESGLQYTSKEQVCSLEWRTFLNHAVDLLEREVLCSLYFKSGGDWRKIRKPTYSFWIHQRMSLLEPYGEVKYYEGFRRLYDKVTYHSWCVLHGKVVDFATRRELNGAQFSADVSAVLGQYPPYIEYVGTEIPRKLLENLLLERGTYLPVISMYDTCYGDLGTQTLAEVIL